MPWVVGLAGFALLIYIAAIWFDVQTEIRVNRADQTVVVRNIHWFHDDSVETVEFSEIAEVRYSEY
ncbi:MAG: hypothetical protein O2826_02835 [Chloroflexi bacterium]|nr:hypothetical protein [Chloroflexota bacterium]MDA1173436.1 hypothetical protein [Chloroflexota bacterium]